MKKIVTIIFLFTVIHCTCYAQDFKFSDSVHTEWRENILHDLDTARQDSSRAMLMAELANYYKLYLPDSTLFYGYKAVALARRIRFPKGEAEALIWITGALRTLGDDSKALQLTLQGIKVAEENKLLNYKAILVAGLAASYYQIKNYRKALHFFKESKSLFDSLNDFTLSAFEEIFIGESYLMLDEPDSALKYCESAYKNGVQLNVSWVTYTARLSMGKVQDKKGNIDLALIYYRQSLLEAEDAPNFSTSCFLLAGLYKKMKNRDSCIYYAKKSLEVIRGRNFYSNFIDANTLLSDVYEKSDPQKALEYSKRVIAYKDSLNNLGKAAIFENFIAFDEQERQFEIDSATTAYRNKVKQYVLIASLSVILLIAFILYRNNRRKQKANIKIEKAYEELKSTQAQLVQREKMASLGELTAGIAHEIQNPLNFVNNFSDVNTELLEELKSEKSKVESERSEELENEILETITQNLEKIALHGQRADAIVKGMLQHSRVSTGQKEPTDINALADEYLRLSYHGLRAKDKSFNATIETHFDETIGKIDVISQDIGRVLLNLFNNAFYAVNEKKKQLDGVFEPVVSVSTERLGDKVQIRVTDNGTGIPQKVADKIFQPFFTTKPTGQGTGLGLSLSYDITKAHGGELKVETKEGEGTTFVIQLPA